MFLNRRSIILAATIALLANADVSSAQDQPSAAVAQPPTTTAPSSVDGPQFFFDVEPFLFASQGYGGAFGVMFGPHRRWAVSVGVFGTDLPDGFRDAFFEGADGMDGGEPLDVRLNWGVGGDIRYRLTGDVSGWQVGVAVGAEQFRAEAPSGLEDDAVNVFVTSHFGYLWHPRGGRFFIYPRVAGILTIADDRERVIGDTQYELQRFVPNFNFRVGFRF